MPGTARSRRVLDACNGVAGGHTPHTHFSLSLSLPLKMTDTSHAATVLLKGLPIQRRGTGPAGPLVQQRQCQHMQQQHQRGDQLCQQ